MKILTLLIHFRLNLPVMSLYINIGYGLLNIRYILGFCIQIDFIWNKWLDYQAILFLHFEYQPLYPFIIYTGFIMWLGFPTMSEYVIKFCRNYKLLLHFSRYLVIFLFWIYLYVKWRWYSAVLESNLRNSASIIIY